MSPTDVPSGRSSDASTTEALIEAVLADRPTEGGPGLTSRPQFGTKMMSRVGTIVATAAGKIALCTAVAAASVAGVYATTDRIGVPDAPDVADVPDAPDVSDTADAPTPPGRVEMEDPPRAANDHGQEVGELATGTDLEGCERGQAISELASANAWDHRRNPDRKVDPCDRSEERGPAAAGSDSENRRDHDDAGPDGSQPGSDRADETRAVDPGGSAPNAGNEGTSEASGRSGERGRPADAGRSDRSDRND